jgi:hypothetical protein
MNFTITSDITPTPAGVDPHKPGQLLVYRITCLYTLLSYIGIVSGRRQTVPKRWQEHCKNAKNGAPNKLEQAIREHGADAFVVHIVARARNRRHLANLERQYVQL